MSQISAFVSLQQLTSLMMAHGVTRAVLCPGSRNSPLVSTLAHLGEEVFCCRSAYDERSAGFLALGWAAQCQAPVAVIVTSGSALLNLHPAVAEAHYRQVSLLVISTDRPAAWIGQQDGQTLPQAGVFGGLVRQSIDLPADEITPSQETLWYRNRLINEALLALRPRSGCPVHLNIPLGEPLWESIEQPLPEQRVIRRHELYRMEEEDEKQLIAEARVLPRRMILLGQSSLPPQLYEELHDKGFVIVGECLSNAHQHLAAIAQVDLILGARPDASWSPDLLITCGGHLVSKRFKQYLRRYAPRAHWHLSTDGALIDTFCCLTRCIEGEEQQLWDLLIEQLADMEGESLHYHAQWYQSDAQLSMPELGDIGYSGLRLVAELLTQLPERATLHLANSLSVRLAQFFDLPRGVQVECNRGTNGIEGSLSTAIGYAQGEPEVMNYLVIGDLSFFYDMNALSLTPLPANLRILLINNGGGGLFKAIPKRPVHPVSESYIVASHINEAGGWARSLGMGYHAVYGMDDWAVSLDALLTTESSHALLIEAFTETEEDVAALNFYIANSRVIKPSERDHS